MASLAQIRTALVLTIKAALGPSVINGYANVPESVVTPAFMAVPRTTDFQRAMGRGLDAYTLDVVVLISRADDQLAQDALDDFVNGFGPKSIRQAVFNARTLGIGVDASVTGMTDYGGTFTIGAIDYVGARLNVEVLTSGTA